MQSNNDKISLTKEGHKNLQNELHQLLTVVRPKVIEELKDARAQGDLSENSDYDAAKNKQAEVENRINEIESILESSKIISSSAAKSSVIRLGSFVQVKNLHNHSTFEFQIVSPIESNPLLTPMKISNESPVAKAVISKSVGDVVEVLGVAKPYKVEVISTQLKG